jgi:UDP-glucose 4-epimerase
MTILVTGTTGLVGARLVPRLVEAGMDCRALIRAGNTTPAGVAAVAGDLLDPSSLAPAVQGVSAIIHLAALFRTPDVDMIWKRNFDGTPQPDRRTPGTCAWGAFHRGQYQHRL